MHVLQVTPYFPPTWSFGGIPRIVDGLSRALVDSGVRVTVLTTDALNGNARSGMPRNRKHYGVDVITVPNLSNRLAYRHQLFLPRGAVRALNEMADDIDVIHLHGHRHLLNNAALSWGRRNRIPYVMTANGTLHRHERKATLKWVWDRLISGRVPVEASRCVTVSDWDAQMHRHQGIDVDRLVRIPNGLDLAEFETLPDSADFRNRYGLDRRPIVAYLGQVSPRKGVDHLVQAFSPQGPSDSVLIVGGNDMGGMKQALQAAGPDVIFTGLLEGRERLELLAAADVLVYASRTEVFGLVPFEGLLCGAPVVVADDCGCGELISQAGAGLLVRYGDVEGLRARIKTLLDDRVAATAMVHRGQRYIEEMLGFDRIAGKHSELYRSVIEEQRGR